MPSLRQARNKFCSQDNSTPACRKRTPPKSVGAELGDRPHELHEFGVSDREAEAVRRQLMRNDGHEPMTCLDLDFHVRCIDCRNRTGRSEGQRVLTQRRQRRGPCDGRHKRAPTNRDRAPAPPRARARRWRPSARSTATVRTQHKNSRKGRRIVHIAHKYLGTSIQLRAYMLGASYFRSLTSILVYTK